jgi:mono/diheme cytochrome c family protein
MTCSARFPHSPAGVAVLALLLAGTSMAASQEWNPDTTFPALPPEEAMRTIEIPAGFRLDCIASEPMVEEPAMMAFDGNGALYVCEWRTYMQDEHGTGQLDPVSRVVKLVDTDGDGRMDQRTVFIDNVVLPRTILPMGDRVLVSLTGSSSIWSYFDDNHDGVSDRRELSHKGEEDTGNIEHQASGLVWNLDNTICSNDFRFRYDGGALQAMPHALGRISQWGMARDDDGRLVCSWGGGANPAHSFQLPAGYPILEFQEHAPGYERPWSACPVWDFSDGGYDIEKQRILTRFSATCGQSVVRSHLMPEFYGNAVTCEPVGRLLRMSRFEWNNGVGTAHNAFAESEFMRSSDAYFRPVWTECGPDGGLYVADLYRGIIQEKTWFPTGIEKNDDWRDQHQERWVARYHRVKKWGMTTVVRHGRIYRILPENKAAGPKPTMLDDSPIELVAHLAHPNGWWRDTAQMLLVSQRQLLAVPALTKMAASHDVVNARIHALWTLQGLASLSPELVVSSLQHTHPRVRRAAAQLAEPWMLLKDPVVTAAMTAMVADSDPQVSAQVFLAFRAAAKAGHGAVPASFSSASASSRPLIAAVLEQDRAASLEASLSDAARQGKEVYESLCIACHGVDGQGVPAGDKMLAPPLVKSPWFASNGNVPVLARILLKGQSGPIDGVVYGEGLMPPLEATHSDEQIAQVLTYVGERWHQWSQPAPASEIASVREAISSRKNPWTHGELKALPK